MSSTNKTTHYELPQFVENDIFNPLVDDNDAYNKIDTALYNIADAEADNAAEIVGIKGRLDTAEEKVATLEEQNGTAVLTTDAQTLSGAVNELKSGEDSIDGRLDVVEDAINNATTGLSVKVTAIETQNGSEVLETTAQTLSGGINELKEDLTTEAAKKVDFDKLSTDLQNSVNNGIGFNINTIVTKLHYFDTLSGETETTYNIQGGAYDPVTDAMMLILKGINDPSKAKAIEVSMSDCLTVTKRAVVDGYVGHGGDVTFNPNTNKFYVAAGDVDGDNPVPNRLAILNGTTLAFENYINLTEESVAFADAPWLIAYDAEKDVYVICSYNNIYTYDNDFNLINTAPLNVVSESYKVGTISNVRQSSDIFNGRLVINAGYRSSEISNGYIASSIIMVNYTTGDVVSSYPIMNDVQYDESESILVKNDVIYLVYQGSVSYVVKKICPQTIPSVKLGEDFFKAAIPIPNDTDLDTLQTVGKYCTSGISNQLGHAFTTLQSEILVFNITGSVIAQVQAGILGRSTDIRCYSLIGIRMYYPTTKTWSKWSPLGSEAPNVTGEVVNAGPCMAYCQIEFSSKAILAFIPWKSTQLLTPSKCTIAGTFDARINGHQLRDIDNASAPNNGRVSLVGKAVTPIASPMGIFFQINNGDDSAWLYTDGTTADDSVSFNAYFPSLTISYDAS